MSNEEKAVQLTTKDLQDIIAAAIAAAKAPNELEQQTLDRQKAKVIADNQTRLESSAQVKLNMANDAARKRMCAHSGGKPVHSHCVFVSDDIGGFVLCMVCRSVIRPENQIAQFPKDFQKNRSDVIFDTPLFNKVFQATDASGLFA